jgi:hypothetical protein
MFLGLRLSGLPGGPFQDPRRAAEVLESLAADPTC